MHGALFQLFTKEANPILSSCEKLVEGFAYKQNLKGFTGKSYTFNKDGGVMNSVIANLIERFLIKVWLCDKFPLMKKMTISEIDSDQISMEVFIQGRYVRVIA
jgi:hypothetical protein